MGSQSTDRTRGRHKLNTLKKLWSSVTTIPYSNISSPLRTPHQFKFNGLGVNRPGVHIDCQRLFVRVGHKLKFYNKTPFCYYCEKWGVFNHQIPMTCQFQMIMKLRKNSSLNWFTPFCVLISPDVIWKKNITSIVSRPFHCDTHRFTV